MGTRRHSEEESRKRIADAVGRLLPDLWSVALYLHAHPELSGEEIEAQQRLVAFLSERGFSCTVGVAGIATSFVAASGRPSRPTVAFIAEYDALPGLGHACGHNLIAASAIGAACALIEVAPDLAGQVVVIGTPAEETPRAHVKQTMLDTGVFDEMDVALMMHPSDRTTTMGRNLAVDWMEFTFKGRPAHASKYPHLGASALDAAVLTMTSLEFLREHVRSDVRIHGIITDGGVRPNIVPESATLEYMVRAESRSYLDQVRERIINCARAGALATGTELSLSYEKGNDNKLLVPGLSTELLDQAIAAGADQVLEPEKELGSTDFGNVSHRLPAATLKAAFVPEGSPGHSHEWVSASKAGRAKDAIRMASQAMAATGYRVLTDPAFLAAVKEEFRVVVERES